MTEHSNPMAGTLPLEGDEQRGAWDALTVALLLVGAAIGPVRPGSSVAKALQQLIGLRNLAEHGGAVPLDPESGLTLARQALTNIRAPLAVPAGVTDIEAAAIRGDLEEAYEGIMEDALAAIAEAHSTPTDVAAAPEESPKDGKVVSLAAERKRRRA